MNEWMSPKIIESSPTPSHRTEVLICPVLAEIVSHRKWYDSVLWFVANVYSLSLVQPGTASG